MEEKKLIDIDKIVEKEAYYSQLESVEVAGRVMSSRESKKISFADISGLGSLRVLQLIFSKEILPEKLPLGSVVRVAGKLILCPDRSHQRELKVEKIIYLSKAEMDTSPFRWLQVEAPHNEREKLKNEAKRKEEDKARAERDRKLRIERPKEKKITERKQQSKEAVKQELKKAKRKLELCQKAVDNLTRKLEELSV